MNYIIDDNSELSVVTDALYNFLKVYDSIYSHTIEIICIDTTEQCKMCVDSEFVEHSTGTESITKFGELLANYLHCNLITAHKLVEDAIILWKDSKEVLKVGILKH